MKNNKFEWIRGKKELWQKKQDTEDYEKEMGSYALNIDRQIVSNFLHAKGEVMLDLPCGTGRFTKFLENTGNKVIGADYSVNMLKTAKKRVKSTLIRCDAFNLPFKENIFDDVLTMRLIFHYNKPNDIIREIKRVLRKDGVFVFDSLNKYSTRYSIDILLRMLRRKPGSRLWFARPQEVHRILNSLDLEVTAVEYRYVLPTRTYRYFPKVLLNFFDKLEKIWPKSLRVLTYWKTIRQ